MNTIKKPIVLFTGLLSGFAFIALEMLIHSFTNLKENSGLSLVIQIGSIILLGLLMGFISQSKLVKSYFVSVFALLYTYAIANLFVFTKMIHFVLYAIIVLFVAVGLFYLSNRYFNHLASSNTKKVFIATLCFVVCLGVCSVLGLFISRLLAPSFM